MSGNELDFDVEKISDMHKILLLIFNILETVNVDSRCIKFSTGERSFTTHIKENALSKSSEFVIHVALATTIQESAY